MSEAEIRLECAKIAAQAATGPDAMKLAKELYQWAANG